MCGVLSVKDEYPPTPLHWS
jgi:hypothetical protein